MVSSSNQVIKPGATVLAGKEVCEVIDFVDLSNAILLTPAGDRQSWALRDLRPLGGRAPTRRRELADTGTEEWTKATAHYNAISLLMNLPDEERTLARVKQVSQLLEVHHSTVYRWIERYKEKGTISGLLRSQRADAGASRLLPEVESLISKMIDALYLTQQRRSMASVAKETREACKKNKLPVPDASTIRARIYALDPKEVEKRRYGNKKADEKFTPLRGSFPNADFPLAVVQIDHTPMDVIVVDDVWRKPINRAYLTVAIDVKTKMVVGFFISLDPPGALAAGQCISNAILDKQDWLQEHGLNDYEWPCRGKMRTVHMDNAKEFRGSMMGLACLEHQINPERRPKTQAKYGGHIERSFRTFMQKIHEELPGTTFSSVADRFDYDSEGKAVMSLAALEKWFAMYILGYYHHDNHSGNDDIPPIVEWRRAYLEGTADTPPTGVPHRVADEEQLRLDFLPYVMRSVQEYGVQYEGLQWYSDSIRRFIHAKDEKAPSKKKLFVCRYDPRDMSIIHFWDDKARMYIDVPFRNRHRPPVSLWEVMSAKKALSRESKSATNEELLFKTIDKMRELVKQEAELTKTARRTQQRSKEWEKIQSKNASKKATSKPAKPPTLPAGPEDTADIFPFDSIRES
nr:helix-turn-helix domain-containing protein [uncultured Albidiferax sp.]